MPTKVVLPGRKKTDVSKTEEKLQDFLEVEVLAATEVDGKVRGSATEGREAYDGAEDGDVVEVEFENGTKQWISIRQLQLDAQKESRRGVQESGELIVKSIWTRDVTTRGVLGDLAASLGAKVVKLLRPKLEEALKDEVEGLLAGGGANLAAKVIAEHFEKKIEKQLNPAGEGVYAFRNPHELADRLSGKDLNPRAPYLLFIHGTASSTVGGFSRLGVRHGFDALGIETTPEWEDLQKRYPDRVIAFEHRTLSKSPLENALELAQTLPERAKLHLVTHSRGGLVGELLCLSQVADLSDPKKRDKLIEDIVKPFAVAGRDKDLDSLTRLAHLLAARRFQIERFVRVACPARGTKLASQSINDFFSGILNVMEYLPWIKASPAVDFVRSTLLALLKYPTDTSKLPGIEAMMPESPFIKILNVQSLTSQSDLAVIEGDIEPGDLADKLKYFAVEKLFREDNDLIVNTRAMSGGMKRAKNVYKFLDQGQEVNHFSYFTNHQTRRRLVNWLSLDALEEEKIKDAGFELAQTRGIAADVARGTRSLRRRDLPVVFVLPGIMGTHLSVNGNRIWLDPVSLALGGMKKLKIDAPRPTPQALVSSSYADLIDFLKVRNEVIPFPYDWRLSLKESAAALKTAVEAELEKPDSQDRPIRFIAHSMGGLVVRTFIAHHGAVYQRLKERDCRIILLGTPSYGSYVIPQLFAGREKLLSLLALVDLGQSKKKLVEIISDYPGLLEMLPEEFFEQAKWEALKTRDQSFFMRLPSGEALREAKALREAIASAVDRERMFYIAGSAASTPVKISQNNPPIFEGTKFGDGRVSYESIERDRLKTWYADVEHGDLADHRTLFEAFEELLTTGTTSRLPDKPKVSRGAETEILHPIIEVEPQMFPDDEDLATAALGKRARALEVAEPHALKVSVVHTHLRNAKHPIAVGHYKGDFIIGAEKVIDGLLQNRLSQLMQAGLYPGGEGTTEVVHLKGAELPGALVIGLGEYGEANRDKLRNGVMVASLRHALRELNDRDPEKETKPGPISAAFSSLLLGTYSSGSLTVADSVAMIVQGAIQANRVLQQQGLWEKVRIDQLEFIELYEDIATEAVHALWRLTESPPVDFGKNEKLQLEPAYLQKSEGGQPRRPPDQYSNGWWRRIKIAVDKNVSKEDGAKSDATEKKLVFTAFTERARAEEDLLPTQRKLIESFIDKAIEEPDFTGKLGSTLFELLVPNAFKDQVGSQGDLLLIVDDESAQYPWELMAERRRTGVTQLVKERGMIRQLATGDFRTNPQAAQGNNVLVVGDPILKSKDFKQLPGAELEAKTVAAVLEGPYRVTPMISQDALTIVNALFERDYRIIHLAGHGFYNPKYPTQSGMVLGDDLWLTAAEFKQMRIIPDLVFINCCSLGKIDHPTAELKEQLQVNKLAASVSLELIKMGVKGVIAAGWEVDDLPAKTFAEVFYQKMLDNDTFGNAIRAARTVIFQDYPVSNTWGAYQCYGNPEFRLRYTTDSGSQRRKSPPILTRNECLDELRRSNENAKTADSKAKDKVQQRLEKIYSELAPKWLDAETLAALGDAWGELKKFDESRGFYERSLADEKSNLTLRQIQRHANLIGRSAKNIYDSIQNEKETKGRGANLSKFPDPDRLLEDEYELLTRLQSLNPTSELYSAGFGSHYKRSAQMARSTRDRIGHLKNAAKSYRQAYQIAKDKKQEKNLYPAINELACSAILNLFAQAQAKGRAKGHAKARQKAQDDLNRILAALKEIEPIAIEMKKSGELWERVNLPDATLLKHLLEKNLEKHAAEIVYLYQNALKDRATQKKASSVIGQMDFLIEMLEKIAPTPSAEINAIRDIRAKLING